MATITVLGSGYQMAGTDPVQYAMNILASVTGTGNSTQRTYNGPFESLIIRGTFSNFNGDGDPTQGTLTSFDHTTNFGSSMGIRVAGLALSVPTLFTWVQTGNAAAMTNAVFGGADTFTGSAFDDGLIGYSGNDTMSGGDGSDELCGDAYNGIRYTNPNLITSVVAGNDTLNGGNGNDLLFGGGGDDVLNGDADSDTLRGNEGNDTLNGGTGDDTLYGGAGVDAFDGGAGNDTIYVEGGASVIDGGDGADTLIALNLSGVATSMQINIAQLLSGAEQTLSNGTVIRNIETIGQITTGAGDDTFDFGNGLTNATIDAGDGYDTVLFDFSSRVSGVTFSQGFAGVEEVQAIGSTFNDSLYGVSGRADVLSGGLGNDLIVGQGGDDVLNGGDGDDDLQGQAGHDTILGGAGADLIWTDGDGDTINGGDGLDRVNVFDVSAATITFVGPGSFTINGDTVSNVERFDLMSSNVALTLNFSASVSAITSSWVNNDVAYVVGGATVNTGSYSPTLHVIGGGGNDTLSSYNKNDTLEGGDGNDTLNGGDGNDILDGGNHNDTLYGGDDVDTLYGRAGNDKLDGDWGVDTLVGDIGDDTLIGGYDADTLDGGAGSDTASYETANFGLTASLTAPGSNTADAAGDIYISIENLTGTFHNDTLIGNAGANVLNGGNANDILNGGLGADLLIGGDGNDQFIYAFGDGADTINGGATLGADTDTFVINGNANENVLRVTFNGTNIVNAADATLINVEQLSSDMGLGTDWLIYTSTAAVMVNLNNSLASGFGSAGLVGFENIIGGAGNDTITGNSVVNRLDGGDGNDTLNGGAGNDILIGGAGADALVGGLAGDNVDGGAGNDTMSWNWGDGADTFNGGADSDTLNAFGTGVDNILRATWNGSAITNLFDNVLLNLESVNVDMSGGVDWLIYTSSVGVSVDLGAGTATGFTSITSVENAIGGSGHDVMTGSNGVNRLDGQGGDDTLDGGANNDTILGGDGADSLIGGLGNDSLQGGNGDDTFTWVWGDGRDTFNGGADFDTVNATGSANENIVRATWNGSAITGLFDNALIGIESINVDMSGGDDWLIYNASAGVSVNLAAGTATGFASITSIERVIGGTGGDTLSGDAGDNRLDGFSGDDVLDGGLGADTLLGGDGADTFVFSSTVDGVNVDTISGFSVADDVIHLDRAIFAQINAGALDADAFFIGAAAADAEDRIIYDDTTGALYYDEDGDGAAAAILFANIGAGLSLTETDFFGVGP